MYRISFDFWPQDNLYPYDPARETEIFILGVSVKSARAQPLPESAFRMTHFRANRSYRKHFLKDIAEPYGQLMRAHGNLRPLGKQLLTTKIAEKYRTVTVHRIVAPISRIITETQDAEAMEAAAQLESFLSEMFGATIPHHASDSGPETVANAFFLRTNDSLDGFIVNAKDGVVHVEGGSAGQIRKGLSTYFDRNGWTSLTTTDRHSPNRHPNRLLHEFVL